MKTLNWLPLLAALGWAATEPSLVGAVEPQTLRLMVGTNFAGQTAREKTASDRQEVERLMAAARAALKEGNYETADSLIVRAEKLNVEFSMFRLGDTPKKLRADYKTATRNRKDGPQRPSKQFAPEMPEEKAAEAAATAVDKAAKSAGTPRGPVQVPQEQSPGDDAPLPLPDSGGKIAQNPFFKRTTPNLEKEELAQPTQLPPPEHEHAAAPPATAAQRRESDAQLLQARRALAEGDVRRATALVETARKANARYGYHDDTPDKVSSAIERYRQVMTAINGRDDEASRHQLADVLMDQAQQLVRWRDFDEAERLVQTVQSMRVSYGPYEAKPQALLEKIAAARKQAAGPTHVIVEEDGTPEATAQAEPAADATPPAQNAPKKSRPSVAAQAVYNQPEEKPRVTRASAQEDTSSGDSDEASAGDSPTASDEALPAPPEQLGGTPEPVTTPAMQFFRKGEQALKEQDTARAMEYFRRAYAGRDHLDETTAKRLQDHLQMLSVPPAGKRPAPKNESLTESTNRNKVLDAKKLSAEVGQKQVQANKLREKEPKRALEILKETRALLEESTVETADRAILLRRVDRSIAELDKHISANRAQIELDSQNKEVLKEVERRQSGKIEIDEKLAKMVDEYQELMDQQRYSEAEVIAKRARELDPENPLVKQMFWSNRLISRTDRNRSLIEAKEKGVFDALDAVEWAAVPGDDREPYMMPDAKKWDDLTKSRGKRFADHKSRRTESELEIERKLKTPVMLKFHERPLSEVLEHLAKLASVNLHLDQKGLDEEGVTSDRTVTINLTNEIQLKSALKLILEPLHLSYVIKDEVLKITSEQLRDGEVYFQTYNVADLVMPIPNFSPNARMGLSAALADAYSVAGQGGMNGFGAGTTYLASRDGASATGTLSQGIMAQVNQAMPGGRGPGGPGGGIPFGPGGMGGGSQASYEELIDLITTTVKPQTWEEVGGPGSIQEFKNNLSLVISQTQEVHEEIVDLLEQLRANQDLQVTIEVRFITLNDNFFERIGVDFQFNINNNAPRDPNTTGNKREIVGLDPPVTGAATGTGGGFPNYTISNNLDLQFRQTDFNLAVPQFGQPSEIATFGFAILSDLEAFLLVSAAQGDRRSNVLQAPKVTMFNGQTASVSDFTQQPFVIGVIPVVGDFAAAYQPVITVLSQGTYLSVQATISNDRRFVRLTVLPFFSQIGDVQEFTFSGQKTTTKNTSSSDSKGASGDTANSDSDNQTTSTDGITIQLPNFSVVSVNTTVSVPDGGTVLLGGIKRLSEGRNEFGVPILSKLPYINRLFKNVGIGRETQSLMMMVTPRIIIQQEEEERLGIQTPP